MRDREASISVTQTSNREMASVTVHVPLRTLVEFQKMAKSRNLSESDLAQEAFERVVKQG